MGDTTARTGGAGYLNMPWPACSGTRAFLFPIGVSMKGSDVMRSFQIGVVMPTVQYGPDRITPRWTEIREMALLAEAIAQ